jgi:gamma-aminobutyric acid type B receptor
VGTFMDSDNYTVSTFNETANVVVDYAAIYWHGDLKHIPTDHPNEATQLIVASQSVRIALVVLMGIVCFFALYLLAFGVRHAEHPVVKLSSPRINHAVILGSLVILIWAFLGCMATDFIPVSTYDHICIAKPWLLACGFSLSFGGLFAKTYRVHRYVLPFLVCDTVS